MKKTSLFAAALLATGLSAIAIAAVPAKIDFEIEVVVPFGVETGEPVRFHGMFHPVGSDLTMAEARRSRINAFGISYEGRTGLSTSTFSWAA